METTKKHDYTIVSPVTGGQDYPDPKGSGRQFPWRGVIWRFISSLLSSALLMVVIYIFESIGNLTAWERRGFNTLSILGSAIVSLSLGSLLSLLGSAIRWPLLARKVKTPRDVDLILGIPNPTGSLKLVWSHTWRTGARWSFTTWMVFLFLFISITGRLSVALLGLTYGVNEEEGIEFPVQVTDWNSSLWLDGRKPRDTMSK